MGAYYYPYFESWEVCGIHSGGGCYFEPFGSWSEAYRFAHLVRERDGDFILSITKIK